MSEAMNQQPEIRIPRVGEKAPHFEALTTQGMKRLEDYQGKYLVFVLPSSRFHTCLHN